MSEVVSFPSKEAPKTIWVCGCGCGSFELSGDGELTCSGCGVPLAGAEGGWYVPALPGTPWEGDPPVTHATSNGSEEFARRRMQGFAGDTDVAGIVIIKSTGQIHTWTDVDTTKDVAWLQEGLKDAARIITMGAVDE